MEKFNEEVNELMEVFNLKQHAAGLQHIQSKEQYDIIDDMFTKIFNKADNRIHDYHRIQRKCMERNNSS